MTLKGSVKAQDPFSLGHRLYWKVIFGYVFENIVAFFSLASEDKKWEPAILNDRPVLQE